MSATATIVTTARTDGDEEGEFLPLEPSRSLPPIHPFAALLSSAAKSTAAAVAADSSGALPLPSSSATAATMVSRQRRRWTPHPAAKLDVVISHYQEKLDWLAQLPWKMIRRVFIYDKSGVPLPPDMRTMLGLQLEGLARDLPHLTASERTRASALASYATSRPVPEPAATTAATTAAATAATTVDEKRADQAVFLKRFQCPLPVGTVPVTQLMGIAKTGVTTTPPATTTAIANKLPSNAVATPPTRETQTPLTSTDSVTIEWISLPNVGRESHTFLLHKLAVRIGLIDTTTHAHDHALFLQGHIDDHVVYGSVYGFSEWSRYFDRPYVAKLRQFYPHGERIAHSEPWRTQLAKKQLEATSLKFSEYYELMLRRPFAGDGTRNAGEEHQFYCWVSMTNHYAVTNQRIHRHSIAFYLRCLSLLCHHSNPEVGHYWERLARPAFGGEDEIWDNHRAPPLPPNRAARLVDRGDVYVDEIFIPILQ